MGFFDFLKGKKVDRKQGYQDYKKEQAREEEAHRVQVEMGATGYDPEVEEKAQASRKKALEEKMIQDFRSEPARRERAKVALARKGQAPTNVGIEAFMAEKGAEETQGLPPKEKVSHDEWSDLEKGLSFLYGKGKEDYEWGEKKILEQQALDPGIKGFQARRKLLDKYGGDSYGTTPQDLEQARAYDTAQAARTAARGAESRARAAENRRSAGEAATGIGKLIGSLGSNKSIKGMYLPGGRGKPGGVAMPELYFGNKPPEDLYIKPKARNPMGDLSALRIGPNLSNLRHPTNVFGIPKPTMKRINMPIMPIQQIARPTVEEDLPVAQRRALILEQYEDNPTIAAQAMKAFASESKDKKVKAMALLDYKYFLALARKEK